jgi:hypothetical protein
MSDRPSSGFAVRKSNCATACILFESIDEVCEWVLTKLTVMHESEMSAAEATVSRSVETKAVFIMEINSNTKFSY